jgi:hypothetical protein
LVLFLKEPYSCQTGSKSIYSNSSKEGLFGSLFFEPSNWTISSSISHYIPVLKFVWLVTHPLLRPIFLFLSSPFLSHPRLDSFSLYPDMCHCYRVSWSSRGGVVREGEVGKEGVFTVVHVGRGRYWKSLHHNI